MKITEIRVKENITPEDISNAIEFIASSCFIVGNFNPYYKSFAERIAVMRFFLDGIEYEDGDSWFEMIENEDIKKFVDKFFGDTRYKNEAKLMVVVSENASDVIEFRKQRLIHGADAIEHIAMAIDDFKNFINDLDKSLGVLANIDIDSISEDDIKTARLYAEKIKDGSLVQALKDAANFDIDKATQEIIDAKNAEIEELKKKLYGDSINTKKEVDN